MPARTIPVTSENNWFQLATTLKTNRQKRSREKMFLVEGVRPLNQLRGNSDWHVEALLYCPTRRLSGWAQDVLKEIPGALRLELSSPLMEKLADREEGSEMIALVRMPRTTVTDIPAEGDFCIVLLDRPGNPGNLGSIIRSCDAFGAAGLVITGHAVDPYDPLVVRASAGAFFSQKIARVEETQGIEEWLSALSRASPPLRIVGTSAKAERPIDACPLSGPLVLLFGNETMGLSAWLKSRCQEMAGLPMRGVASSLNLAAAVTAVLYERDRQRRSYV